MSAFDAVDGSSESWELQQHPRLWHSRAGGGAVHSIKSGHGSARSCYSITWSAVTTQRGRHSQSKSVASKLKVVGSNPAGLANKINHFCQMLPAFVICYDLRVGS